MTAFGAPQGGKSGAYESQPREGNPNPGKSESPAGDIKQPVVDKGIGGSKRGFGA